MTVHKGIFEVMLKERVELLLLAPNEINFQDSPLSLFLIFFGGVLCFLQLPCKDCKQPLMGVHMQAILIMEKSHAFPQYLGNKWYNPSLVNEIWQLLNV